ncbi:MAG: hypothetical protein C5B54_02660 [Acidobacteria bacterium]|nr:MAG: hypothetical protein C5B54_02660 [Acidobacteriota bacterium]
MLLISALGVHKIFTADTDRLRLVNVDEIALSPAVTKAGSGTLNRTPPISPLHHQKKYESSRRDA